MKTYIFIFVLCFTFVSCDFSRSYNSEEWPPYTTNIAWDSGIYSNYYFSHIVDDDYVYFYERPPGYTTVNIYTLTKLDARTGEFIWRAKPMFSNIIICPPVAVGGHIYVFLEDSGFICFDKESGKHTATVEVKVNNEKFVRMTGTPVVYDQYLYMCIWDRIGSYFNRIDVNTVNHEDAGSPQFFKPEIIWEPKSVPRAKPVVHNNTIYTATWSEYDPVEFAGFDLNTKQMVFYETFGGPDGTIFPEKGGYVNPIFINGDTLYYLNYFLSAWNINTGKLLFRHVFTWHHSDNSHDYSAPSLNQAVYYQEKIYYSSKANDALGFRNIHCINAKTGKPVWNTIAKGSVTLDSNVIINRDRLYIAQHQGFFVYNPANGKLIGVDRSFYGADAGSNVLYNDYMICVRKDNGWEGKLVAVYVGK